VATKPQSNRDFGQRLKEAFGGDNQAKIAEKLGISDASVSAYIKGESLPSLDNLKKISALTKRSLHWLLTGEGEADLDPYRFLNEKVRALVERMAANDNVDFGKALELLVVDALVRRGSYLFTLYPRLRGREMDELRLLFSLIQEGAENDDVEVQKPATKGQNVA
jgi:transcriptional regulator with XRE-family HTH domain